MKNQMALTAPNLSGQVAQLTFMAGYLPEPKRGPFLGRLKSFLSLGATQRQVMVEYLFEQLVAAQTMDQAKASWDRSQAEGILAPSVQQIAQVSRDKITRAEAALKAATKINKLNKLVVALAQLAAEADVASVDELVQLSNEQLSVYIDQLGNDDYAVLAPFLSLPKR